jgi:hypothetical protein
VFDTTNWRRAFERAKREIVEPALRWHDLRHTVATWLGQQGVSLEVIRDVLGHSSVSVTEKYRHVIQREVRAAVQKLPPLSPTTSKVPSLKRPQVTDLIGAGYRTRTCDPLITNQVLYQLS